MLITIEDVSLDIVQVDACYRILDTTFGQSGTYRILISTKDIEAHISHQIQMSLIKGASMGFVMVTTWFVVISLEVQALDFQVSIIAPVAIGCLCQIVILIIIPDMQLFNLSILQGELEDFVFGLLLLFLIPFLGGIQQELIVGRPIFWFDDEQVDTTQPTFFQGDTSAQQRQQTEIAKDLLHTNQIPLLLVFQAHAIGSNMLPQKIDADTLDLNFRIQFLFKRIGSHTDESVLHIPTVADDCRQQNDSGNGNSHYEHHTSHLSHK